ncbi:hypothetical protein D3C87_928710 [compost metagenome]
MLLVGLRPATEGLVDGHQRELGELLVVLGLGLVGGRAVEVAARDVLAFVGVQVLQVLLGHGARALLVDHLVDHRHAGLGQDGDGRHDDLELLGAEFLQRQEGFVFPGQQHVAHAALHEGDGRAARAGVEHGHVLVQVADEFLGLGFTAVLALGEFPGREVVPAGAARGLGVGGDHLHAGLDQVVPVLQALGVALLHQEHDGRGVGGGVVRQALLPVGLDEAAVRGQGVDVAAQRQRGHVGIDAVDDRTGLLARAAVRLLDAHVLAGLGLPVLGEGLVVVHVQLAGRVVRHVQQRHGALGTRRTLRKRRQCRQGQGTGHAGTQGKLDKVAAKAHGVLLLKRHINEATYSEYDI